jgi:hypothetical protein
MTPQTFARSLHYSRILAEEKQIETNHCKCGRVKPKYFTIYRHCWEKRQG